MDAIVFLNLSNIRYLCGFTGTDGALVVTPGRNCFLTDSRYTTQARGQVCVEQITEYRLKIDGIVDCLRAVGAKKVGFEAETITFATLEELRERSGEGIEWVPLAKQLKTLRSIKTIDEIEAMEKAAGICADALAEVLPLIRPGAIERDIALALEFAIKQRGAEEKSFDFIVASGERGALPHGIASERALQAGDLVTIDFGARLNGYHSDETVTLALGDVRPELRRIFDTVLEAHDRALALIKPGVALREVDAAARQYIADSGYGEYFGHGLGHGVGLEVHESPVVSPRADTVAEEGMVFTVEPGIYVPGLGGVRIEDMVAVTSSGARRLTRIPKDYRVLAV
ncbi:integrase [Desulfuromonas versatilis]|uniref:Integrase n=1 Tax=Desulfuromonas versatilis TaxID=2802975 RepID=A0ABN6DYW2_9BACT|nr:integrase [Desulfuromonas versatilis]